MSSLVKPFKGDNQSGVVLLLAAYPSFNMMGVSMLFWSHLPDDEIRSRNCTQAWDMRASEHTDS